MNYYIRKYKPTDRESVRNICHLTATDPEYVANKELVATLYSDYYTDYEPEGIFIIARENDDEAVGYILSAVNFKKFWKNFNKYIRPKVVKLSRKQAVMHDFSFIQNWFDSFKYPAHLHIDILPEAQRQGFGTKLMDYLIIYLKENKIKGVQLGVGGTNEKGINFYKKYGFKMIHDFGKTGKVFAMDLKD